MGAIVMEGARRVMTPGVGRDKGGVEYAVLIRWASVMLVEVWLKEGVVPAEPRVR